MPSITRSMLRESWRTWLSNDLHRSGPRWMAWMWTLLFCAAMAMMFTLLGFMAFARDSHGWRDFGAWAVWYSRNLVVCVVIGATIHLMFDALSLVIRRERIRGWANWQRTLFFSGVPLLGVVIGWPLGLTIVGVDLVVWGQLREGRNVIFGSASLALLITFVLHHFFAAKGKQIEAERRATEAQLRLLQAQMEPHFLFNTLANVQSLIDHEPARAKAMLESFTDYLRATLSQLRTDDSSVGAELALAETYLRLLQMRMDDRLHYRIEADAATRAALLPPLMLQPLVENAIHHGLEPKVAGGTVVLQAQREGEQLRIDVVDDGLGLNAPARRGARGGAGVALVNLRERLASRFGDDAGLVLADEAPGGTRATITLPFLPQRPTPSDTTCPPPR